MPREHAPLGRVLPYQRTGGGGPASPTAVVDAVSQRSWSVDLGERGLGDLLLGLSAARALHELTNRLGTYAEVTYQGSRMRLMERCHLPMCTEHRPEGHVITTAASRPVHFPLSPEKPPAWLDEHDDESMEVHASLPMRYYLELEQLAGLRLPAPSAPLPAFAAHTATAVPYHVVFVTATSWPARKDYGLAGFARLATCLTQRISADWQFTVVAAGKQQPPAPPELEKLPHHIMTGPDAVDCLDIFAAAQLVIGNDTGLTHLAALCTRPDGTGPHVIGLYGRHAHTKWTTGSPRHHAVATRFSQMMSAADACPVRDSIDDTVWGAAADIATLPPESIAEFAGECVGWW